ncbi:hypothetical protein R5R35_008556 [Gryllus longicercus]|uniref:ARID domain-containing protein n=1 Tax=Gryllus longicercus TaxID=2509291 RepID=A0AAN9VLE7_9ORTH
MRPTPSPTGSTGSRSMSPAVGQQNIPMPPRPSSGQSDGSGPARMSHSPMATPGGYQQPLGPPHMHGAYKIGSHPPGIVPPTGQQMGPYTPPSQQYSQGNYVARPQGQLGNMQYGPTHGYGQQNPQGNSLGAGQYPNRPMPNHVPHSQFGGYQGWGSPGIGQGPPSNAVGTPGNQMPPKGPGPGPGPGSGPQPPSASTQGTNASTGPRSLTPPHYLKQHLQHKMSYGSSGSSIPPSAGSLQVGYGGSPSVSSNSGVGVGPSPSLGPGMGSAGGIHHHGPGSMNSPMGPPASGHLHPGMGPPAPNMGPPGPSGMGPGNPGMGPPSSGTSSSTNNSGPMAVSSPSAVLQGSQGPSVSTNAASPVPNSHHDGPMPPPITSSNSNLSHPPPAGQVPSGSHPEINSVSESPHDNGIATTTTVAGTTATNVTPATPGTVTSVVTTGPDGTPLDEGSQQSTLSNASQASGEDQNCTPKSRKDGSVVGGYHSHPPTPQSTVPSPGAASLNSVHEEYDVNSPSWPRTPASPKPDSLCKLYEMDDSHERRMWLDKLLQFMEERGTPISACPTISKNPLDLFRLYLYVKERGGFMEVTKNKTWKDIAGLLGIGASSSAAYTLRKHYMKNLLAYECHFDRGGIDPQSIINQVEATSKKKGPKAVSVPSPGSSNSQDSFPAAGSSGASMDGFSYGYPPGSTPDFNTPLQRPASQTNAPSPHPGVGVPTQGPGDNISVSNPFDDVGPPGQPPGQRLGLPNSYGPSYGPAGGSPRPQGMQQGYQGQGGYSQYPQDQYGRSAPSSLGQDFNQQYSPSSSYSTNRGMYPPYGPDADRNYNQGGSTSQPSTGMQQTGTQDPYRYMPPSQPPVYPARAGYGGPPAPPSGPNNQQQPPAAYPGQQDYYRPDQVYPGGQQSASGGPGGQMYPAGPHNKSMPPPAQQPRRHPDFAKDQPQAPYPQYGQQRQPVYGWSGNNTQYRGQFPPQGPVPQGSQQWPQGPPRPSGPPGAQGSSNQWDQHRYPAAGQSAYQQPPQSQQQWVPGMATPGVGQSSPLRTPMGPRGPYRPEGKPFPISAPPGGKGHSGGMPVSSQYPAQSTPKREIVFPPDSVEATMPVLYKRKRMTRTDVSPVEAWRLMMSLRSGLLAESCWALDVLNILLFDDCTVAYFGLAHMPGLLDVLLEHFRRSLADMFDAPISSSAFSSNTDDQPDKWYHHVKVESSDVDLGSVTTPLDPEERVCILQSTANYTLLTRKGEPVKIVNKESDIFVLDNRKVWDVDGDVADENVTAELEQDPWQLATSDNSTTKYIVTCFQGEFGNVPFVRVLPHKRLLNIKGDVPNLSDSSDRFTELSVCEEAVSLKSVKAEVEQESDNASEQSLTVSKEENTNSQDCVYSASDRKNCDKKKRTNKTLSEVLSRIKKEPVEMNDLLSREIREKVEKSEIVPTIKKDEANTSDTEQNVVDMDSGSKSDKVLDSVEDGVNGISFENGTNSNNSNDSDKINDEAEGSSETTTDQMLKTEEKKCESPLPSEEPKKPVLNIRDPAGTLKRRRMSDYEDECYTRDEASLYLVTDTQDALARRCVCLSNILRNLTFVPGNEVEFAKNPTFLGLLGKLLLLHHEHPARTAKQRNYDREEDADFGDSCSSLQGESEWWWDFLHHIRENALVTAANIAGHMDLGQYPEEISRPVLDGLLHWAVCPAAHGQDPFPTVSSSLSPQRLALEALCKLCVTENNVDLVIATPPYSRLERLCAVLTKLLCRGEEQVLREFAVNLLHYLAAADSGVARTVALQSPCVSLLVAFIEQAEASALGVANQHGIGALRDNPDSMGTSLDMLRRAAGTLLHLARHPDNRPLFLQQEQRLLALVMSQILDHQVASIISRVLFQCSRSLLEHGNSYTS